MYKIIVSFKETEAKEFAGVVSVSRDKESVIMTASDGSRLIIPEDNVLFYVIKPIKEEVEKVEEVVENA